MKFNPGASLSDTMVYGMAATAVITGSLFYLLCRTHISAGFVWVTPIAFWPTIYELRSIMRPACSLPPWALYTLPDGLWSFAFATIMARIWWHESNRLQRGIWLATIPLVGVGYEAGQAIGIVAGTFSWMDLSFSILGIALGFFLCGKSNTER